MPTTLPPCGLYRTRRPLGEIPAGRLVYFHNHGDPGPGLYLPASWQLNRAVWQARGTTLQGDAASWATEGLAPLAPEGLYRVREAFHCCEQRCRLFEADLLVQLGYDAEAHPILFVPELSDAGLGIPETGTGIDAERVSRLERLKVVEHHRPHGPVQ